MTPVKACLRIVRPAAAAGAVLQLAACSDSPTRPPGGEAPPAAATTFTLSAAERGQLSAALAFASRQLVLGLEQRDAADRVATAFAAVSARIDADDPIGAERALGDARAAIADYRRLSNDTAGAVDLETMHLTLDRATAIVRESQASQSTATSTTHSER